MTGSSIPIVALDVPTAREALEMAEELGGLCRFFKVGSELFTAEGPGIVRALQDELGADVFLDLKFHDIPNTVAGACRSAARLGVWMMNIHASGGAAMMRAARDAIATVARPPLLIGVTILTSLGDADLAQVGYSGTALENVERLARLARECGLDGVVCSAREAQAVRRVAGADFALVTPGIRLAGDGAGDQSRVVTPQQALALGADYLVIGRSITAAADPIAALESIQKALETGRTA